MLCSLGFDRCMNCPTPIVQHYLSASLFLGLPYISLGTTDGIEREYVGHFDDGVSHAIHIPDGFPFGDFIHSSVYVSKYLQVEETIILVAIKLICLTLRNSYNTLCTTGWN